MKKLFILLALLFCVPAFATTSVFSDCGVGHATGCVAGNDGTGTGTVANPYQTSAKFKTVFQAASAGDHLQFCQGGAWDAFATGNMSNSNSTAANPVVIESVDCTAFWSGGAGIKPKLNNTSATGVLSFNTGSAQHHEGYTVTGIEIVGDGVNTIWGILIPGGTNNVIIDNVKITGTGTGIQCNGGTGSAVTPSGSLDGISKHLIVRNSTISSNNAIGVLSGCSDTLIEKSAFDHNGTTAGGALDHDIYMGGATITYAPQTITSLVGSGTTVTMTTASPHLLPVGAHFTITNSTASAGFTAVALVGTVTGASTLTYPQTGVGTAASNGTYTTLTEISTSQYVIRNNTLSNGNVGAEGLCKLSHIVSHGDWKNALIEGNLIFENTVPTSTTCDGIEVDSGGYAAPENYEKFNGVVIRGNTVLNAAVGISLDLAVSSLIENNYVYSTFTGFDAFGIRMRAKNFVPGTVGSSTLSATQQSPNNVTIRYNSVYLTAIGASGWGITLNGNVGDPLTGLHHNVYGNVVVLGASATASTECFDMQNMTTGMFDVVDYNACYYLGATLPKWSSLGTLAAVQALGLDTHSTVASTASVTTGQPFFTSPTTGPNISTSSALKAAGHPTLGPKTGWGASKRHAAPWDIGAFSFGDTTGVVPDAPVNLLP